jgi:serine O-acetyltransferase
VISKLRVDCTRYRSGPATIFTMLAMFLLSAGFRAVVFYRLGHWCRQHRFRAGAMLLERLMHHLCHCWIGTTAEIGEGFLVAHVCGLIIGGATVIGKNCDVRQNITFGGNFNKVDAEGRSQPTVGDNVSVGAGAVIVGPVKIGNDVIIGANAVVTRDVPDRMIVGGNPAKIIKERWSEDTGRKL